MFSRLCKEGRISMFAHAIGTSELWQVAFLEGGFWARGMRGRGCIQGCQELANIHTNFDGYFVSTGVFSIIKCIECIDDIIFIDHVEWQSREIVYMVVSVGPTSHGRTFWHCALLHQTSRAHNYKKPLIVVKISRFTVPLPPWNSVMERSIYV